MSGDGEPGRATPGPPAYGERFKRRWRRCFLILAVIGGLVLLAEKVHDVHQFRDVFVLGVQVIVGAVADGLLFGSLVCLLVAIPRGADPGPE